MKRWLKSIVIGLLSIASLSLLNNTAEALNTPPNCIRLADGLRCADSYCTQGTFTCNADGSRCLCNPVTLASTKDNELCYVASGSEMYFTRAKQTDLYADKIYLKGGIWKEIINFIKKTYPNNYHQYSIDSKEEAIVFTHNKDYNFGNDKSRYTSNILEAIKPSILQSKKMTDPGEMKLGIDVRFSKGATKATVLSQFYEVLKNNKPERCGTELVTGNNLDDNAANRLFVKKSPIYNIKSDNENSFACYAGPTILKEFIIKINETANDSESGGLRNCFYTKNNDSIKYEKDRDLKFLFSNIITVDKNLFKDSEIYSRIITERTKEDSIISIFGYDFNTKDVSELSKEELKDAANKRLEDISKIKQTCETTCSLDYLASKYGVNKFVFDNDLLRLIQPKDCAFCPKNKGDKNNIVYLLENNPNKSLNNIIADELAESDLLQPSCTIVNSSFGDGGRITKTSKYTTGEIDDPTFGNAVDAKKEDKKTVSEKELNSYLPYKLTEICDKKFGDNDTKRMRCKYNATTCYESDAGVQLLPPDICSNLPSSVNSTRWAFCPGMVTGAGALNSADLGKILSIPAILANNDYITAAWKKTRNIANVIIILVFLIVIISQITSIGLNNYQIKKILPRIIVTAILINVSLYLMQFSLDISNILGNSILKSDLNAGVTSSIGTKMLTLALSGLAVVGTVALILATLSMIFPMILIILIGILFTIVLVSIRQFAIVALIIIMPIAIASSLLPNGNGALNKTVKAYIYILLIYPAMALFYSIANYYSAFSDQNSSVFAKIVSWIAPYAAILLTPMFLMSLIKMIPVVGDGLAKLVTNKSKEMRNLSYNNPVSKHIANINRQKRSRFMNRKLQKLYGSKVFNALTNGQGKNINQKQQAFNNIDQNNISNMIGKDKDLEMALKLDGGQHGENYMRLNESQKTKYDLINRISSPTNSNFWLSDIQTMAKTNQSDINMYKQSAENALKYGATQFEVNSAFSRAMSFAMYGENIESLAALQLYNEESRGILTQLDPPENIKKVTKEIRSRKDKEIISDAILTGNETALNDGEKEVIDNLKNNYEKSEILSAIAISMSETSVDQEDEEILKSNKKDFKNHLNKLSKNSAKKLKEELEFLHKKIKDSALSELNTTINGKEIAKATKVLTGTLDDDFYNKTKLPENWSKKKTIITDEIYENKLAQLLNRGNLKDVKSRIFDENKTFIKKAVNKLIMSENKTFLRNLANEWHGLEIGKKQLLSKSLIKLAKYKTGNENINSGTEALTILGFDVGEDNF